VASRRECPASGPKPGENSFEKTRLGTGTIAVRTVDGRSDAVRGNNDGAELPSALFDPPHVDESTHMHALRSGIHIEPGRQQ
jgi:hypothetical protein